MKGRRYVLIFAAGLLLIPNTSVSRLNAQSDRGTITGTVTDPTGAAMVAVSVTTTNSETGVASKTTSSANGSYAVRLLSVGTYEVSAEQQGFKRFVRNGIILQIGQTARVDIPMELGRVSETVEVQADAPTLLPNTSDLGTVVTQQQFRELPLIGQGEVRNPTFFMILVPGVTGRGPATFDSNHFSERVLSTTVNGSQSGSTEFHLDGSIIASAAEFSGDPRNVGFPPDAVGGFKMITLNAPAEYGHSGGGIAAFTTKSGTNQLHGSVYEYFRNDVLDARGFFSPTTPTNRQNEFGFTVGGPIHKDKTFFFGWYNGFRLHHAEANSRSERFPLMP
jgi:Carboxypeptidase regulatory-like domain